MYISLQQILLLDTDVSFTLNFDNMGEIPPCNKSKLFILSTLVGFPILTMTRQLKKITTKAISQKDINIQRTWNQLAEEE
jgi:hypothetical protein